VADKDKPETSPRVAMRLGELAPTVDARADHEVSNETRADAIRRMVERYEWVTEADRPKLSVGEWKLICDALNGTRFHSAEHLRMIWGEVADAIKLDALDKKWDVSGAALTKRLRELSAGQLVATIDAVEQFWIEIARGDQGAKVPGEA
jgi:hypothetical protein